MKPPSPFDITGPSTIAKDLTSGHRISTAAAKRVKQQREAGANPSQVYGLSAESDESLRQYKQRRKK